MQGGYDVADECHCFPSQAQQRPVEYEHPRVQTMTSDDIAVLDARATGLALAPKREKPAAPRRCNGLGQGGMNRANSSDRRPLLTLLEVSHGITVSGSNHDTQRSSRRR